MEGTVENKKRLEVVGVENIEDETCRTFVLHQEDHTLGNALRYVVTKSPEVEFCGYSVPHPSENKINFRIQTKGEPASKVLEKGLSDLSKMCEHMLATFRHTTANYKRDHADDTAMDTGS